MASAAVPMSWNPNKNHSDRERWVCMYPAYINSRKSLAEGRRIPKEKCVDNPTYQEMRDVLQAAGLTIGVENKLYPREPSKDILHRGRIRVHLRNDDKSPINPNFPSRAAVMLHLCEMIPKLKSRTQKQGSAEASANQNANKKGKGKKGNKR